MKIIAYVLNISGLVCLLVASLIKGEKMKKTLFLVLCGNLLTAIGYLCGGNAVNGSISCFLGTAQTAINYLFDSKNKPIPKWLVGLYALSFIGVNIWIGGVTFLSILTILACMTFIMGILQKSGTGYRIWTILNCVLWSAYDIFSRSYNGLIAHLTVLIFSVAGMIINDRKNKKEVLE